LNNDNEDRGGRDPLRAAFDDYERAPRDVVPQRRPDVEHTARLLRRLADGHNVVEITHYDVGPDGVTKHVEKLTVCAPITSHPKEQNE
jgi:hypothetical protein